MKRRNSQKQRCHVARDLISGSIFDSFGAKLTAYIKCNFYNFDLTPPYSCTVNWNDKTLLF